MDDLMTVAETSAFLRVSIGQLATMRYTASGPRYFKPTAKTVLYSKRHLIEWIEASARLGTAVAA